MIKCFWIDGVEHIVTTCTAVAYSAGDTEADRQNALLIAFKEDDEWFEGILFDPFVKPPETAAAFEELCSLDSTWDNLSTALEDVASIRDHGIPGLDFAAKYSQLEGEDA